MRQVFFVFLLFFSCILHASSHSFLMERGDFEKAQSKAKNEGKLLFLDFYASWCAPCKWMDETTFRDPSITSTLQEKFIAIKVNIDDFEGFELKSKFDIRYLPTIIIFNSDGVMIERVEETLGTIKMQALLDETTANNPSEKIHAINSSPSQVFHEEKSNTQVKSEISPILAEEASQVYKLQMGVFSSVHNASKLTKDLKRRFVEPISITEVKTGNKVIYKVMLGNFKSMEDALKFKKLLSIQFNMDSIIL